MKPIIPLLFAAFLASTSAHAQEDASCIPYAQAIQHFKETGMVPFAGGPSIVTQGTIVEVWIAVDSPSRIVLAKRSPDRTKLCMLEAFAAMLVNTHELEKLMTKEIGAKS